MQYRLKNGEKREIREEILTGKTVVDVEMVGGESEFSYKSVLMGREDDEFDIATTVVHVGEKTKSNVHIKGVLKDRSVVKLTGLVKILRGARGSDGRFKAEFLVFDNAVAKPIPSLEIEENDVQAGHAAWVTKVSEEMLFYMMARGLTKEQAEEAIVEGFLKL